MRWSLLILTEKWRKESCFCQRCLLYASDESLESLKSFKQLFFSRCAFLERSTRDLTRMFGSFGRAWAGGSCAMGRLGSHSSGFFNWNVSMRAVGMGGQWCGTQQGVLVPSLCAFYKPMGILASHAENALAVGSPANGLVSTDIIQHFVMSLVRLHQLTQTGLKLYSAFTISSATRFPFSLEVQGFLRKVPCLLN